jgi:hypothetical protein
LYNFNEKYLTNKADYLIYFFLPQKLMFDVQIQSDQKENNKSEQVLQIIGGILYK